MSRYIIGIDLGTTNITVSFLDTSKENAKPELFSIPQLIEDGECDSLPSLPSFLYLPEEKEITPGMLDLPWASDRTFCVGAFARKQAASLPDRVVSSAKSWLCVKSIDPLSPILPRNQNARRLISPIEVSRHYLEHIRDAWNSLQNASEKHLFEQQDIILTVPASFDAIARDLTVQAAKLAGLSVVLLEEPQSAFYAWLQEHEEWRDNVSVGDRILVCDIGGGTTDFSLIEVTDKEGDMGLERIAVGNHILLGGDNFDLAIAYFLADKMRKEQGISLNSHQMSGFIHGCREAKEALFEHPEISSKTITILGRGSRLIGGTIKTELHYEDIRHILLDGFFPSCSLEDTPSKTKQAGLREFGLSYESDPAITKHLATFLSTYSQPSVSENSLPNLILYNGGVSKAKIIRERIYATLCNWHGGSDNVCRVLEGALPDIAVSTGACWYGYVRLGNAIRIKAGSPCTYYVGVASTMPAIPGFTPPLKALCVVPFGMEEGSQIEIPYAGLGLVVGEPTEFRFFASNQRQDDQGGEVLENALQYNLAELPELRAEIPLETSGIPPGTLIPVQIESVLSAIGTLDLWCIEEKGNQKWKLEYDLRDTSTAD